MKHYFPHDYSAYTDQKILRLRYKHGAEGYGIYWMLLETMAQDTDGYINTEDIGGLSLGYGVAIDRLSAILNTLVKIDLFSVCEHGNYYSPRMLKHKKEIQQYSEYGKKGAEIRWKNKGAITSLLAPAMQLNNIKRNNIKEQNIIPTIENVKNYCIERKNNVDPEKWFDFYSAKGWMIGKNKMKDWKAAVRTWEKNEYDKTKENDLGEVVRKYEREKEKKND